MLGKQLSGRSLLGRRSCEQRRKPGHKRGVQLGREEAQRAKAALVHEAALAKVAKGTASSAATTTSHSKGFREGGETRSGAGGGGVGAATEEFSFADPQLRHPASQFAPYFPPACAPSFTSPPSPQPLSPHFFLPSPSTVPPFSQFDVHLHPHSMAPSKRFSRPFQARGVPVPARPWSLVAGPSGPAQRCSKSRHK